MSSTCSGTSVVGLLTRRAARIGDAARPAPYRDDLAKLQRLDRSGLRSIFLQCQVDTVPMIIVHECPEVPVQASLVEHDSVIQALAAKRTDEPLHVQHVATGSVVQTAPV